MKQHKNGMIFLHLTVLLLFNLWCSHWFVLLFFCSERE